MNSSSLTNQQSQNQNKCPECLFLKCECTHEAYTGINPIKLLQAKNKLDKVDILLTINFGEQWENLFGGKVKFGIRSGELKFHIKNGKVPYENRHIKNNLDIALNTSVEHENSEESSSGLKLKASSNGQPQNIELSGFEKKEKETIKIKQSYNQYQVTTKGTEEDPIWSFQVVNINKVINGSLTRNKIFTIDVESRPVFGEAIFEVLLKDILITDSEGFWEKPIITEKRRSLDTFLAKILLEQKLVPYLSKVVFSYA